MYLARYIVQGKTRYSIRESYRNEEVLTSRELFDLGTDPTRFIVYPGGNAFYIDLEVEDRLEALGVESCDAELEDVFWPFIRPDIRRVIEHFRHRRVAFMTQKPKITEADAARIHLFDKRRLFYLKTGRVNQQRLGLVPAKHFGELVEKSRDEIEQQFLGMERILKPKEVKTYVYVIFNLQRFFTSSLAKTAPELMDQAAVDTYFTQELCRLNDDQRFWVGLPKDDRLHTYLARYAVMFYDYEYPGHDLAAEFMRNFINRGRRYRPPSSVAFKMEAASQIFGQSISVLRQMSRSELARLYRKRALALHPDQGGDHNKFVRLTQAYHGLLAKKRS